MAAPLYEIAYALWFILPAYAANAIPVLVGGGRAIDGGKTLADGRPVFGSHKTVRGFVAGVVAGFLVGAGQTAALSLIAVSDFVLPFEFNLLLGFLISLGALIGDLGHSFVKRRLGIAEGSPLPIADQLDFVVGAVLFGSVVSAPPLLTIFIIFAITVPVHLLTNFLAYLIGVKKNPW